MSRIYRSPLIGHIDLDKIIRISDAQFFYGLGRGDYKVGFSVDVQLRDGPILYQRNLTNNEECYVQGSGSLGTIQIAFTDGTWGHPATRPVAEYLCIANLQVEVAGLISAWKWNIS